MEFRLAERGKKYFMKKSVQVKELLDLKKRALATEIEKILHYPSNINFIAFFLPGTILRKNHKIKKINLH